jgi:hypothetical protein
MREFQDYLKEGSVHKQTPNIERAYYLLDEAKEKKKFLNLITTKAIPKEKWNHNVICEQCYDIIMETIRAKMFIDGFKSSSHEAEVSYLKILNFEEIEVKQMDELRYYRNGIKYYGIQLNLEYAEKTLIFLEKIHERLLKLVND